jgi:hypothetical protein
VFGALSGPQVFFGEAQSAAYVNFIGQVVNEMASATIYTVDQQFTIRWGGASIEFSSLATQRRSSGPCRRTADGRGKVCVNGLLVFSVAKLLIPLDSPALAVTFVPGIRFPRALV